PSGHRRTRPRRSRKRARGSCRPGIRLRPERAEPAAMSGATRDLPRFDHAARRAAVLARLDGGIAVFRAPALVTHHNDVEHRYRPESDFFYLTGFPEPDAIAVLN